MVTVATNGGPLPSKRHGRTVLLRKATPFSVSPRSNRVHRLLRPWSRHHAPR